MAAVGGWLSQYVSVLDSCAGGTTAAVLHSKTYEKALLEVAHCDDTSCDTVVITAG